MFKNNEYVQKFLELWNIPRYRSLIKLCIYFIFFLVVIASINTSSTNHYVEPKVDVMEEYKKLTSYHYTATIKNEIVESYVGYTYNNKHLILFNEDNYYYEDDLYKEYEDGYQKLDNALFDFDIWKFTPSFISSLIQNGEFSSKTEYVDGSTSDTYLVSVSNFISLYFNDVTNSSENISITIYKNEDKVKKVELDLTNIYNLKEFSNAFDYKVTIEYVSFDVKPIMVDLESSD